MGRDAECSERGDGGSEVLIGVLIVVVTGRVVGGGGQKRPVSMDWLQWIGKGGRRKWTYVV